MTAELIDFPSGARRPNRTLTEPCQVLILPVVRIERDDTGAVWTFLPAAAVPEAVYEQTAVALREAAMRDAKRQAWLDLKARMRSSPVALIEWMLPGQLASYQRGVLEQIEARPRSADRRLADWGRQAYISWDLGDLLWNLDD